MRRRLALLPLGLLVLLGALGAAVAVFRIPLAEAVIENRLAAYGLDSVRLRLDSLGFRRARVAALTAGENDELRAQSVMISYDLPRLFESVPLAAVDEVVIDGLSLRLDLTGEGPPLGSLQGLLSGGGGAGGAAPMLPPVTLRDARIEADTPLGRIATTLEGTLAPTPNGRIAAELALGAEGGPGRLRGTLAAEADPEGTASGSLRLDEGRLQMIPADNEPPIAVERLSGRLDFALEAWRPVALTGAFAAEGLRHPGGTEDSASLTFDASGTAGRAEAHFAAADGLAEGSLTLSLDEGMARPGVEARLTAEAGAGARLLALLPPPRPAAGSGRLELRLAGRLAPFDDIGKAPPGALPAPPGLQPLLAWLGQGDLSLDGRASLDGVALPGAAQGLTAALPATLELRGDTAQVTLAEAATLSATALDPDWLAGLGVPAEAATLLGDGGSLTVSQTEAPLLRLAASDDGLALQLAGAADIALAGQGPSRVTIDAALAGAAAAFEGTAEVTASAERISAGGTTVAQAEAHLPLAVERGADRLRLLLSAPGRLAAGRVERAGLASVGPAAALDSGWLTLGLGPESAGDVAHEIEVSPAPFTLSVPGARGPIAVEPGALSLSGRAEAGAPYAGTAKLASGTARFEAPAVTFDGLRGEARFDASFTQVTADLTAAMTSRNEPALLAPLALAGRLVREGPMLRLTATASPKGAPAEAGGLRLPITARYDLDKGSGEASLAETRLTFTPGGLQPRQLLPALTDLANVAGDALIFASLPLGSGAAPGTARLALQGLSFRSGGTQVRSLDLTLALDSLQPPASPPGQRLAVARVESILPIEDIEATFGIPAADQPQVRLARLAFTLAGGTFEAHDSLLALDAARPVVPGAMTFDVTGLELAPLFEALSVQGLTGSGTLDGRIPIALEGNDVAVEGGHLESRAGGTLSYRSPSLKSSLPPDADDLALLQSPVDLAILALGNFHYDKLTLDLDKAAAGETSIKLHVEGKNPDLLDGYPFVFNINLRGNLNPLIAALRQGATLSDEMIRRTWKATP